MCLSLEDAAGKAKGLRISDLAVEENRLHLTFVDGSFLQLWDDASYCCERRYLTCDDDLQHFKGAILNGWEVRYAKDGENDDNTHETAFLIVSTSYGTFTVANHNEHNGYYGGFDLSAEFTHADPKHAAADDAVSTLERLYRDMTPAQVAAHEDWVRRFKAEKAREAEQESERERARRELLRAMSDEDVARALVGQERDVGQFLAELGHAGFIRRVNRTPAGPVHLEAVPSGYRFVVEGRRGQQVTAAVHLTLKEIQAGVDATGLDVNAFRRLGVCYDERDPADVRMGKPGQPAEGYVLPRIRQALVREHRAIAIRAAVVTAVANGWRVLDATGQAVTAPPTVRDPRKAVVLQTGAEFDEEGDDGIDPDNLVLVEFEYEDETRTEEESRYRLATFSSCPPGRRLAELCLAAMGG